MKHKFLILAVVTLLTACSKVPVSNRKQMNLLPESELVGMGLTEYKSFLSKNPAVGSSDPDAQMVKRVGQNIQAAVVTYLNNHKMGKRIAGYKWEFNLVNDKTVNAWCMPGGKVVVYSGLLAVTQNEAALAVVMGHEIAHAVARHGNERMSQELMVQAGGAALSTALATKSPETQTAFMTAYGVGSQVGAMLPFSRLHESEADKLGLIFSAMAGYDPREAPAFWQRMAKASGGGAPPELLSTHPSDQTRISDLNKFMPEAMKFYQSK
jgi:predicted Zn-dependent protease